ncbi:hypothetical protein CYMTET_34456 [Cymbomonas tetramitiformis]|uniref:Uncharacterized protein n=1 Tax=Cymbomonas tetramitiformis TaxID=36881 RepID=A0AAE0FB35_9CHLO|nr:hypothetical protein CYMTET_34456 [Cymbomonas tetramitiformis]
MEPEALCWLSLETKTAHLSERSAEENRLIILAQDFIETGTGFGTPARPELIAEDFVFRGPVIGPLCKKDYLHTLSVNKVYEAFPDLKSGAFGYTVDPAEPKRVWLFTRYSGTNTGDIHLGPLTLPATSKVISGGAEVNSVLFDEHDKVKLLTVGYIADRDPPFNATNQGAGALVGLLNACGINLPSSPVFKLIQYVSGFIPNQIRSISVEEDIPEWYKNYVPKRRGAEGVY